MSGPATQRADRTPGGGEMTSQAGVVVTAQGELPDGVLPKAERDVAATVGLVAVVAMAEAAYNLGAGVLELLKLPLLLALAFPLIGEAAATSFALQDLRDRRRGVRNAGLRRATYVFLAASAAVNAAVGAALAKGAVGLLEMLPPLVLGAVIHLHGERANRAWKSRARLRPAWRAEQLRAAQVESVLDVLPLLAGEDQDGRATVALLRRRLETGTLEPGDALIAAGWHDRDQLSWLDGAFRSRRRRLEIVAATVWGPVPPPPPRPTPRTPSPTPSGTSSLTPSGTPSRRGRSDGVDGRRDASPTPRDDASDASSSSADAASLDDLVAQARRANPRAGEGSVRALLAERHLTASAARIRAALQRHQPQPQEESSLHLVRPAHQPVGDQADSAVEAARGH